jgi:hypothetical protein
VGDGLRSGARCGRWVEEWGGVWEMGLGVGRGVGVGLRSGARCGRWHEKRGGGGGGYVSSRLDDYTANLKPKLVGNGLVDALFPAFHSCFAC